MDADGKRQGYVEAAGQSGEGSSWFGAPRVRVSKVGKDTRGGDDVLSSMCLPGSPGWSIAEVLVLTEVSLSVFGKVSRPHVGGGAERQSSKSA